MQNTGSIENEFAEVTEHWSPRVIADLNGQSVKVAKIEGELVWHAHAEEDEMFLVWKGEVVIRYRDRPDVHLREGDFHVVPRGVEHHPLALSECWIMLFEPSETKHTGETVSERSRSLAEQRRHLPA
jgi:mannose-6-phosphate isomerase-like protein (cupin superfamily)